MIGGSMAWLDIRTHESLIDSAHVIATIEKHQGLKVACSEEILFRMGHISAQKLEALADPVAKNGYGRDLMSVLYESIFR